MARAFVCRFLSADVRITAKDVLTRRHGIFITESHLQKKQVLDYLDKSYIAGLSLLGGEPFEHVNQQGLLPLLRKVKARFPEKNIWCYTGYDFEKDILGRMAEQWEETKEMLSYIDVLVDGEFKEALKSPSLQFKGSSNQRIIEVQPSLKEGHIVLWEPKEYVHVEVREN